MGYPAGENVEQMVMEFTSICDTLDQQKILPDDSIYDIIQGLSLASHIKFSKMFADYASDLKNPLMQSVMLNGSVLEQISTVLETALREYASYSLSTGDDAWMQGTTHAHKASVHPNGFKCDNCLGPHFMNNCPKDFDEARIAKNRKACSADPSRSGRGGGAHTGYGRGKFGAPAKDETVRLIDR